MITYCPLQRHLVDSRSDEGSSGCQNVNTLYFEEFFITYEEKKSTNTIHGTSIYKVIAIGYYEFTMY